VPNHPVLDRRRAEIARAFVDREPIDWVTVLERAADARDRATLDALCRLDALRGGRRPGLESEPPRPWTIVLQIMVVIATTQVLMGLHLLAAAASNGAATTDLVPHAVLTGVLAAASLLLGTAVSRDHRAFFLLATFMLTASAFVRPLVVAIQDGGSIASSVVFRGVCPDAFAPAALWQFVAVFPAVRRFTRFDVFARRAASTAGALAVSLFLTNLLLAYGVLPESLTLLARQHPRRWFWHLFAGATLPALAVIVVRAHRAPWNERVKVLRLGWAIGAGAAPMLAVGAAETLPAVASWMVTAGVRPLLDGVVISALAAMPILATFGVLVDDTFGRRRVARLGPSDRIARYAERLDAVCARVARPRRLRERLSIALDRVRLARGSREISAVLQRELQAAVGTGSVTIVPAGALPPGTALLPILEQSSGPIDLSRTGELFRLLPPQDRECLEASGAVLAAAVRLRDGAIPAVILLGHAPSGESFDRSERWFIKTLLTAASAAWDAAGPPERRGECADECVQCGRVRLPGSATCCAGAETRLAALPKRLGDRFEVTRRLGAGGMGVVYLGHDFSLGRDVALKTWTGVCEETMTRLCDEARLMAGLNHDVLATIYGLERWRRTPVLVMEYCAQGTLADVISRAPLPVDDVLRLGIRVTDGLAYMHDRGVLHRDIKPSNIGFTAAGVAKLLDFGLAGADDQPGGTPAYLPPEALNGARPSVADDLWGLATVLKEACGGSGAPGEPLDAFFRRALAARPADRFQSSLEMRAALSRLLVDANPKASPRPTS
jgi:hypothetical protein